MEEFDVVVIGAGLAGLQCARLMGQRGLRILLVDRKDSLHDSIHTTGIFVRRTLEDFHFPENSLGPAVRDVTLYSPSRRPMNLSSPHDEFRVGRMGLLYQSYLDNCLSAGVRWLPGTKHGGHSLSKDQLIVQLDGNGPRQVKTRYLVGADGASSRVAKGLGLDTNRNWIVGVEDVLADVPLARPPRPNCFHGLAFALEYLVCVVHARRD